MINKKRFFVDRLCIILGIALLCTLSFLFEQYFVFALFALYLILTIFFFENEILVYFFERKNIHTITLKAIDGVGAVKAITAKRSYFVIWRFETEDGRSLNLLDPTLTSNKTIYEREKEIKDKNFIVSYCKHSQIIVALEEAKSP